MREIASTINFGASQTQGIKAVGGDSVDTILKNVFTLFFVVGGIGVVIYFLWGSVDYILAGGDKEKISSARKKITNALIGLALLAFSYFIIGIVGKVVGFNPLGPLTIPQLGTPAGGGGGGDTPPSV